jgi:hypothetical protein
MEHLPEKTKTPAEVANELLLQTGDPEVIKLKVMQTQATLLARATVIPEMFRNNIGNCYIALSFANRVKLDPFFVMNHMYEVNGRMGLEGQLAIALLNQSGLYQNAIDFRYEGEGVGRKCTAVGVRFDGVEETAICTIEEAKKRGWWDKRGSAWPMNPDQMLAYRSAAYLIKLKHPELLGGMQTIEELRDIAEERTKLSDLNTKLGLIKENKNELANSK